MLGENKFMFEYRKIVPEEKLYVQRLQNIVFGNSRETEEQIREKIANCEYDFDETYCAADENGRVIAGMEVIPYTMWFDGHKTSMYGIGGVASAPESRRAGHVRKLFEKAFDDIYEKGCVFSHLYPFSHDYYRKFGYEPVGAVKKYTLPLEPARKLKSGGAAHDFIRGDSAKDKLIEVYENYASRHNLMISRTEDRWDEVFDVGLFGSDRLYYWKGADGNIKSWVKFKKDGDVMEICDIAWTDCEGMLGILQFIGMFDGAAEKLSLKASSPEFVPELYWNDLYDVEIDTNWIGMTCIVDVERALELMKKPDCEGRFTIKVIDNFARWNNNTYAVEYGGGNCAVRTADPAVTADIETSQLSLVLMLLGAYDFEYIAQTDSVCVNNNMQTLKKVFYKKNLLIADYF
jgi:predicted acetyltransferase